MDPRLQNIEQKLAAGERLDRDDALALFTTEDLFGVGRIAHGQKEKIHGDAIYFGVSLNLNHTNICSLRCPICAFSTDRDADNAFVLSRDEICARVADATRHDISEVHIVGGLHDSINLGYFKDMFAGIQRIAPAMNINALTATECDFISRKDNIPLDQLFRELKEAGLGSMPGGGAEIFDETIRRQIAPLKISGDRWLEVSRAAHQAGIKTNATMLWGHIESYADRVDHMLKLRELQDQTSGFKSFVPLLFHPQNTQLSHLSKVTSAAEILKVYAAGRLVLDNFPHIKALWMYLGLKFATIVLRFGADDMGATSYDERIVHAAGSQTTSVPKDKLVYQIRSMQLTPHEVDSNYRLIKKHA